MLANESDSVREYAYNYGMDHPDQYWVLSPFDSWERNPHYNGPTQLHPEAYDPEVCGPQCKWCHGPLYKPEEWLIPKEFCSNECAICWKDQQEELDAWEEIDRINDECKF